MNKMKTSRKVSPARSQGTALTPRLRTPSFKARRSLSVGSARSNASGTLTAVISAQKMDSFVLSPLISRRSILSDNTEIGEPRRKSWYKKLGESSRDIIEVLEENKIVDSNNIIEELDIEILSQEKKHYTMDLPESSDSESINSIVVPQRKLFTQEEHLPQKKFGEIISNRDTMAKIDKQNTIADIKVNAGTRELFQHKQRSRPIFPAALLDISPNKTKYFATVDPISQVRNIFGHATKRKNIFSNFIVSESEDEIPEIQAKVFGFQKKNDARRRGSSSSLVTRDPSPTSSIITDTEMEDWKMLPSSTMVENQLEIMMADGHTPKKARLSKLTEDKESETGSNATKQSVTSKDNNKSRKSKTFITEKDPVLEKSSTRNKSHIYQGDDDFHDIINEKSRKSKTFTKEKASKLEKSFTREKSHVSQGDDKLNQNTNDKSRKSKTFTKEKVPEVDTSIIRDLNISHSSIKTTSQVNLKLRDVSQNASKVDEPSNIDNTVNKSKAVNKNKSQSTLKSPKEKNTDQTHASDTDQVNNDEDFNIDSNGVNSDSKYESNADVDEPDQTENKEKSYVMDTEIDNDKNFSQNYINGSDNQDEEDLENENEDIAERDSDSDTNISLNYEDNESDNQDENEVESNHCNKEIQGEESENEDIAERDSDTNISLNYEDNESDNQDENEVESNHCNKEIQEAEAPNLSANSTDRNRNEDILHRYPTVDINDEEDLENESENEDNAERDSDSDTNISLNYKDNESDNQDENEVEGNPSNKEIQKEETPNLSANSPDRNRNEDILHRYLSVDMRNINKSNNHMESFTVPRRNTSVRSEMNQPSLASARESITQNSSAEVSGWDSHRTTRKTLRQTFGKDFTPRKSIRALVLEKSAKRQTAVNEATSVTTKFPLANSTELPEMSNQYEDDHEIAQNEKSRHDVSPRTRQKALEKCLQHIRNKNMEAMLKAKERVRKRMNAPPKEHIFKVPAKPMLPRRPVKTNPKKPKSTLFLPGELPAELLEDLKYKPPKRFQPRDASWTTKSLYKYLETKLEPKYDYKARVRAEKLVEHIYQFTKDVRKRDVASPDAVDVLKHEMARLNIVKTHYEFYNFFSDWMPREVRIKVIPDIANKIPSPRRGIFADIL